MVGYEQRGHVAVVTLRRPEARNAVDVETATAIEAAVDRIESDPETWVAVLAAEGPVFCAGADLKEIAAGRSRDLVTERGGFAGLVKRDRATPLVAAVDGPALGGGCELVLACDLVVASTRASFGLPEVKRSLLAAAGGLFRLPHLLPRNVAMELALTGDPLDATRAHAFGLVNELTEPGAALDAAVALAERICANGPVAVRESRRVVAEAAAHDERGWELTRRALGPVAASEDVHEGPRAFLEKRPPVWKGR